MDSMDIDSPPDAGAPLRPRDRIVRRLAQHGVPTELLERNQAGLVDFVKGNKLLIPELVSAMLPTDEEVAEALQQAKAAGSKKTSVGMKGRFRESMVWLRWLMFESEPAAALKFLSELSVGQRGVCAAVWGNNDIAYRCRTCEYDPTCAICVPCFQHGNHEGHDYSVIYTGGGCCDCGDVTAWKREGFCSKHKGAEQIQPLPEDLAHSVGPVLDALFICWKNKLLCAETGDRAVQVKKFANELTFVTVEMLLEFCKYSESLLSFVSRRISSSVGLLEILVKAERYLSETVVKKLHELLLKLLGEPVFKYEFAKVFLDYYPVVVNEVIKENNDRAFNKYQLLPTFSVQIFTVPTLTPRLVKEINLLTTLLGCLRDIFISCAGEDGRLQVTKWGNLYELTIRVVEDIRFVMSHAEVPKYVTQEQRDILKTWIKLVGFVQGINPQKRETGIHIEEENDNMHIPFGLCHCISSIHVLMVNGAFSVALEDMDMDDIDGPRHAKVGRLSEESSAGSPTGRSGATAYTPMSVEVKSEPTCPLLIPPSVSFLTYECLRAIENSLGVDNTSGVDLNTLSPNGSSISSSNFLALRRTLSKIRKGRSIFSRLTSSSEDHGRQGVSSANSGLHMNIDSESGLLIGRDSRPMDTGENDSVNAQSSTGVDDCAMEAECAVDLDALRVLSLANWPDIYYDVSSQEISIHIPLHRLLALLLQKALGRCYGESGMPNMTSAKYSDFFGYILGGCHPYGFSAFVMEHPLRTRVFCAQVHAGMWRKNGDTALLSCECYRTVRWSGLDLEFDLFLLQCCASLAPADDYVSRILERFGLSSYLLLHPERSNEYESVLVQEMLTLLIQIVKERRFCGLSTAESVKRELIHKLVVGDATHSQLVKSLPRDLSKFDQLQNILDTIAQYSNPSGINQGKYSLRWAYWKELDLYHPRWSLRDLQVAEERYQRFCSVSAFTAQLPKWTSIYPPLKGIAGVATCRMLLQIVRSVLFYAVFTDKLTESRAPDGVLLSALHLLSLALDISFQSKESGDQSRGTSDPIPVIAFAVEEIDEALLNGAGTQSLLSLLVALMRMHRKENMDTILEVGNCNLSSLIESLLKKYAELDSECMNKLQQLAPEVINQLPQSNGDANLLASASDSEKRKAKARERQAAILEKMRAEQSKFMASIDTTEDDCSNFEQEISDQDAGHKAEEPAQDVCSLCHDSNSQHPVSFLVLLQKSRLLSFVDRAPPSWKQARLSDKEPVSVVENKSTDQSETSSSEESSSCQLVQLVQGAVNEFSVNGQHAEMDDFLEYIKARFPSVRNIQVPSKSNERKERNEHAFEKLEEGMYLSIRRDVHDHHPHPDFMNDKSNVSAADGSPDIRKDAESILLGKYIAALSKESAEISSTSENPPNDRIQLTSNTQHLAYDGLGPASCDGIFVSSCGHAVHQGCLDRYLESVKERSVRRIVFEGGHIVDPDQGEFLCPVCRRLANSVLPALPGDAQKIWKQPMITSSSCIGGPLVSDGNTIPLRLQQALCLLQAAAHEVGKDEILKALPLKRNSRIRPNLDSVARVLSKMYLSGKLDKFSKSGRLSHTMTTMWDTLKYSIASAEIAARSGRTYMTTTYGLDSLYREFESSSGFILSLLLRIVQSMRSKSTLLVLQRFRGTLLFADSICSGVSVDHPSDISQRGGNMWGILKHVEKEASYAEIQFWNRASDPILSRDPFSSLMWSLFCLPFPFLSCEESFLSLVHIFYLVCVAQGIVTYCGKYQNKISGLGLDDCLITDIFRAVGESKCAQQYFVSNYIDPSLNIEDIIRSLSFPYLRRCALLWKLLNSPAPKPFCEGSHALDGSSHVNSDIINSTLELAEIQKLQDMFKIPSIDIVLRDRTARSLVSKWFSHFCNDFESRKFQGLVHSTPAVPFQLMHLPHVYQDLLQRYIKQHCLDCKSPLEEPALCLLCGRLCAPRWKSCCRESECQTHAIACGAGIGVFLLIRRTTILLQRSARQAPWPSPYLDAFGEEDVEMQRGKPLYLNEERYAALNYMVASHGLDRSSKVLGQTTIGSFFLV